MKLAAITGGLAAVLFLSAPSPRIVRAPSPSSSTTPLRHIVVVIQENRTVDNLFQKLPGADTQSWGMNSQGQQVTLRAIPLNPIWDPDHSHRPRRPTYGGFATEYDNGRSDGWDHESFSCEDNCSSATAFAYVKPSQVKPYYQLAEHYAFADEMLQVNEGPSFPAHQYLIAGQAGGLLDATHHSTEAENPLPKKSNPVPPTGGCDVPDFVVQLVDMSSAFPGIENRVLPPCLEYQTIFDTLDAKYPPSSGTPNWRFYAQAEANIWNAPIAVKHLYQKYLDQGAQAGTGNFSIDPGSAKFAADVAGGTLPPLTYVTPCDDWSDHPEATGGVKGPDWVGFIANTIGKSKTYWKDTAIVVVWDDWGGWFDHVVPPHSPNPYHNPLDPNEYGYRVPMIVISPYVRTAYISHTPMTQMAILTFIEHVFGLPSLQASDQLRYSGSDLFEMFDFNQAPQPYHPVAIHPGYFPTTTCHPGSR